MRAVIVVLLIGMVSNLAAQNVCATHEYTEQQAVLNPLYKNNMANVERFIQHQLATASSARSYANSIITIPVVVHVLYNTAAQNISDEQIKSQLTVLNKDYRRKNSDSLNTPDRFKGVAADAEIEFALATADPNGRPTTGIVRKYTTVTNWQMDDKIKLSAQGGDDGWDSKSYLNIWIGSMRTLLGYSSAPGGPADKDGVVINPTAFGTINTAAPYNLGRTTTHEIGHWLGLRHIWGDESCGDDYVDDTPTQGSYTTGCPNGFRTTCNNGPLGDMYMNYMDFTNDACLNLFTEGQKKRMRALFSEGGVRNALLSSKGLNAPWVAAIPLPVSAEPVEKTKNAATATLKLYPNPAQNELTLSFGTDINPAGIEGTIFSITGQVIQKFIITSSSQKINTANLKAGMYFIQTENGGQKVREMFVKL